MSKCHYHNCNKKPTFNVRGEKPVSCVTHKSDEMVNVNTKICKEKDCNVLAMYGYKDEKATYCAKHKVADMINLKYKTCEFDGCMLRPSFNTIDNKKAKFCANHKTDDMVNVVSKRCKYDGCNVLNPSFDYKGGYGSFCSIHTKNGMIDVKHKTCEFENCMIQPAYDIKGGKGRFCSTHKLDNMVDIKNSYCEYIGCMIVNPIFNTKGSKKGRFCIKHKEPSMVDVKHKLCEYDGCEKRPTYDVKGGSGRFCIAHKSDIMIDITHKSCKYENCIKRANYDVKGGSGKFCVSHKEHDMIDIANKCCIADNCNTRPTYGKPGNKVSHCSKHREKGMILKPNRKCLNCSEMAIWGINFIPQHCELHKTDDEHNLLEKECISCGLLYVLDKENKCENCNPVSWEKTMLSKQNALMTYLDNRDLTGDNTDHVIDDGKCGRERPDRIFDFDNKIVILECDENQHKDRACLCEQTRMVNIGQSFGGIPVYFIRFNPDHYIPNDKSLTPDIITKRYKLCGDLINDIKNDKIKLPVNALVSSIYLYFDGWSNLGNESWNVLTSMEV